MSSYGDPHSGQGWTTEYDDQQPRRVVDDRVGGRHAARPGRLRAGAPEPRHEFDDGDEPPAEPGPAAGFLGRLDGLRRFARIRRKRIIIVLGIVLVIVISTTTVVTYYFDSVDMLDPKNLATQTTKIFGSDGKTQIAQLGTENREDIPMAALPADVRNALIAGEDKEFYDHDGVSFSGIARAAWNNVTGGDTQGASTITQQYVKIATKDLEMSVFRKMREAVLARKLENEYSKEEILGFYLNNVYFGRGAVGVQVASKTFFGKNAKDLTIAEAAVLGAVVRQPEQTGAFAGYDPQLNAEAAKDRWNYVLDNMVDAGWLDAAKRGSLAYPKNIAPIRKDAGNAQWGIKGVGATGLTTGNVLNYLLEELKAAPYNITDLKTGGYRITTTINPKIQAAAEAAARRGAAGSLMTGQKANVMSAVVAVEPKTGRVLAYYGGDDGTGHDYAGLNIENGSLNGGHPAGSSFKPYTLAAALKAGYSLDSHFDPAEFSDGEFRIENAGRDVDSSCGNYCTLEWATVHSYNVPFYKLSKLIGVDKVLATAKAAGVHTMWSTGRKGELIANDLTSKAFKQTSNSPFYYQAGFGQYPITVLDHATGMATFANRGTYNTPHFLLKVERLNAVTGKLQLVGNEKLTPARTIDQRVADDVNWVLQKIPPTNGHSLSGNRPVAGKTGTWQCANTSHNCHAWYVGHTKQIAAAVWVGNTGKEQPVYEKSGRDISGAGLPGAVWEKFMNAAHKGLEELRFADKAGVGDPDKDEPGLVQPTKPVKCRFIFFCPDPTRPDPRPSRSRR